MSDLRIAVVPLLVTLLAACSQGQPPENIQRFSGDFRYYRGIAEFFDCKELHKYYLHENDMYDELLEKFAALGLDKKEDAYLRVKGYWLEEEQMDGVDPLELLAVTEIIEFDASRSCQRRRWQGQ